MDTSVKNFQRLLNSTGEFMRDEIENLPLKKYEWVRINYIPVCMYSSMNLSNFSQWLHPEEITPFFLFFKDLSREGPYLKENDLLYKFYVLGSFMIIISMGINLILTQEQ